MVTDLHYIMKSVDIREQFLEYFEKQDHKRVMSSSLIPANDPTLLFTNAGMNQFKDTFLGNEKRSYRRATSCQKCVRAGGKHNDLDNVGKTNRHHTFFEMLGNFSFGDYFKVNAIEFAWDLVLNGYKMDEKKLWVSIYEEDDDAFKIWNEKIGLPAHKIVRLGAQDNFWSMGETGPCGPCSEIYYDQGEKSGCGKDNCSLSCDCERYLEFWNLVFMQYNRNEKGELEKLPSPSIDTGLGLERVVALLQNKASNYDTDLFIPLIKVIGEIAEVEYPVKETSDNAVRVVADHSRAIAFLISEGITPSNEGRGYVLRRIIRRACRYGKLLQQEDPFVYKVAYRVTELMGNLYPELIEAKDYIARICHQEEERFHNVVSLGIARLEELIETAQYAHNTILSGSEIFKLYDTFGMPLDLVEEIAAENALTIDYKEYTHHMEIQKTIARAAWKGEEDRKSIDAYRELSHKYATEFLGYDYFDFNGAKILSLLKNHQEVNGLKSGETGELLLDKTVFYGESGGQVGDQGIIKSAQAEGLVIDTHLPIAHFYLHKVAIKYGELRRGDTVDIFVNKKRRFSIMRNHTATHLLNAALRQILGTQVKQSGSLVSDERFRFDFTHFDSISPGTIKEIETLVNEKICENLPVKITTMPLENAVDSGALAFFGEKYEDSVRVISIQGFSKELCGGTHCNATGQIGLFIITKVSSIAAGIRRIEGITGAYALENTLTHKELLHEIGELLKIQQSSVIHKIKSLLDVNKELEKQVEQLKIEAYSKKSADTWSQQKHLQGIEITAREIDNVQLDILRALIDEYKAGKEKTVIVLGSIENGKAYLAVGITTDIVGKLKADKIIKEIAPLIEGGGGGRQDFAQAGGKKCENLRKALEKSFNVIENMLQ